jgi:chromate transporter
MLLPGPEAMQLATYAGWRMHGVAGGLTAGLWFVMPGALVLASLAVLYVSFGHTPLLSAAFLGIKAAVLVLVFEALVRLSRRALNRPLHLPLAVGAFLALFAFGVPFPIVVLAAGLAGALVPAHAPSARSAPVSSGSWKESLRAVTVWGALWVVPLWALGAWVGAQHVLTQLAWFFSKLAVVTFGGAYAVLTYMAQDVVVRHGWLDARQMVDALGLAETTPGPLILVTMFVGFLAAANAHPGQAIALGLAGAAVALWATFVPCFLWIFAGAPHLERISAEPRLRGALEGITAAVLGVIANLGLWFAIHVLFEEVRDGQAGILRWTLPVFSALDWRAALLSAVCALLLLRLKWSVHRTLAASALLAWGLSIVK